MKFLEYLEEKYYDLITNPALVQYFGGKKEGYPVFVNPTSSEIKELPDKVRFVADSKKKDVYVWDAEVIHSYALPNILIDPPSSLTGTARKIGGKLSMFYSDQLDYVLAVASPSSRAHEFQYLLRRSWIWEKDNKWVNKYVDITQWLKRTTPKYEKIKMEQQ